MNACAVEGCGTKCFGYGFCNKHYIRWRKYGDPLKLIRRPKGLGTIRKDGYHQKMINGKTSTEGRIVAEKALGKPLPINAMVHHVDGKPSHNENMNLVVCQDNGYHRLFHRRTRAYKSCGHANWLKCSYCGSYDAPQNMSVYYSAKKNSYTARHLECGQKYMKERRRKYHGRTR